VVQAWATGTITVRTELSPARRANPEAWVSSPRSGTNHRRDGRFAILR
jgi:hypothetical protein